MEESINLIIDYINIRVLYYLIETDASKFS